MINQALIDHGWHYVAASNDYLVLQKLERETSMWAEITLIKEFSKYRLKWGIYHGHGKSREEIVQKESTYEKAVYALADVEHIISSPIGGPLSGVTSGASRKLHDKYRIQPIKETVSTK